MPEYATLENMTMAVMYLNLQNYVNNNKYNHIDLYCEIVLKVRGVNEKIASLVDQLRVIQSGHVDTLSYQERERVLTAERDRREFPPSEREKILTAKCNQGVLITERAIQSICNQINIECEIGSQILRDSVVGEVDLDIWNVFYERYSHCAVRNNQTIPNYIMFDTYDGDVTQRLKVDGVTFFGLPIDKCRFYLPEDTGLEKIQLEMIGNPLHVDIYRGICAYHSRDGFVDVDGMKRTISKFSDTTLDMHCHFGKVYELVKYELIVLETPRNFCRLQEKESLAIKNDKISIYWFDANDFPQLALIDEFYGGIVQGPIINEINSKLAIECDWYSPNYLVEYEFPPGAMFLKCQVAPQKSRIGGGFEYVYLNNVPVEDIWKQSVLSTKEAIKPRMAAVIGGTVDGKVEYVSVPHITVK